MQYKAVAIFGSRSISTFKGEDKIKDILNDFLTKNEVEYFIVPNITGACEIAKNYLLDERRQCVKLFPYKKEKNSYWEAISGIKKRTKQICNEAEYFLVFHDGQSNGTKWDIKQIEKLNKKYEYHLIKFLI